LKTDEWQVVSINYLKHVHDVINEASPIVETYGDAFEVLEYLHKAKVVELAPLENEDGVFKIRKVDYSG
jgi:hypothetical protein